ncbi:MULTISPECIES: protein translocase subunit SecF [Pelosinus]|jgi:preprotein translocase subunit SecF|uniref:Protein-export membrane protein SecF n=1 Tax=Pelosinus fermentans B4 TaxID=1149862 RepID=I8RFS2_9FIRM|nr:MULTISPECIES: protein translocase subunit SecF [Pelosinus]EIW18393.1 protein-export membrane protein SecF [Pelosinus fermentans B4]EIW24406.1 protein-export membrane protein SecF [Pelosinus fermentans A11]OAM94535.1 SecF protein [Pelosinus fermentans DSM 17108]SDR11604.1 preprotein translocase subunit SecF [Pelosinus fermentans]
MKFDIIGKRYWWFALSLIVLIPGLISMALQGFNLGIDFTGGTILDLKFASSVTVAQVREVLVDHRLENSVIQLVSTDQAETSNNLFIRTHVLSNDESQILFTDMEKRLGAFEVLRSEKVGAVMGSELTQQALLNLAVVCALLIAYISYRFEYKIAVSAILAILHDVMIVLGIFSLFHIEMDSSFVAAILTVIGYSMNEAIVVFDRIRENLKTHRKTESFQDLVNRSIGQTFTRTLYTLLTVLFACGSLHFFGGESTKNFSLAMLIGFLSGAYSAIFNASPIWVTWKEYDERKRAVLKTGGSK